MKKVFLLIVCAVLLIFSGYSYIYSYSNDFDIEYKYSMIDNEIKYRYDTTNGYVGMDIVLNSLVSDSNDGNVASENTKKLQEAMNKVSDAGGGTIYLPSGVFYFGRGGMNSNIDQEDFAIKCRNNVHLKGAGTNENSSSYTILKPLYDNPSGKGGMDMFYFNNYKDTGFGGPGITTSTVKNVSYIDASGNTVTWKNQTVYLINADFSDFVIDGDSARGGIASLGGTYRTDGKGFMINLFADCDWNNVVVKNVDATGFGVDCPINSTINNCKAINCGKAATKNDGGASGFGIGTGYSNDESLVINNCVAINNKKFGFFFEHQARFSNDNYKATKSKGFVVSNSVAGGNLYDYGGLKSYDVTYENNKVVSNYSTYSVNGLKATNTSSSDDYTPLIFSSGKVKLNTVLQPIYYSLYSTNSFAVNTDVFSMLGDVSSYKDEVRWAVNSGIIPVNSATVFGSSSNVSRMDAINSLFAYKGRPGTISTVSTTVDKENAVNIINSIGYSDLGDYQDDLDSVIWAYNAGIISKDSKFNPASNCTRAQFITMLYRLAGSPNVSGSIPFNDVKSGSWYHNAVLWGYNVGIIKGIENNIFSPDSPITKLQLAIFLHRFKNSSGTSFTIKYNVIGGSVNNNTSYNSNSSFRLNNPSRSGYTFLGWTGSNGTTPSKSVSINKGTTGNLSYTANWSANLTNIFIKNMPKKTVYKVGDNLDLKGLVVGAKYGDNNIRDISDYKVSISTLNTAGVQNVVISYGGLSTSFNVTVNKVDVNISKVSINTKPNKLTYFVGDTIDTTGLILTVLYSNGTTDNINTGYTVSPTTLNKAGTQNITVKYDKYSTSYSVTVKNISLSKLELKSKPNKLVYFKDEYLDTTGLVLLAIYNNGIQKEITTGYDVSMNKLTNLGNQNITIKYGGKSCSFGVTVNEEKMISIKIKKIPNQTNYFVGDKFSSKGLKVVGMMNSSYEEEIDSYTLSLKDGDKLNSSGVVEVIVKYKDFNTSFNIEVCEVVPETIVVTTNPNKTTFIVGEDFTDKGLVLEYVNEDGSISVVRDGYSLSIENGKKLDTEGTHNVTISYNGKTTDFMIDVIKVLNIIVNDVDLKKNYKIGEEFDSKGLVVIAEYSNGFKQELKNQYSIEVEGGNMFTSSGNKVVNIEYGGIKKNITVFVDNEVAKNNINKLIIIIVSLIAVIIGFISIKNSIFPKKKVLPGVLFYK